MRRRPQYVSPPNSFPNVNDEELEDIGPKAYFASFDQVWDRYAFGNWITIRLKSASDKRKANPRLIFKAYKRVYGPLGPSIDDHTWIELMSDDLVKFLRSQHALKGVDGLNQSPPGVDARDLFLRLDTLKTSAVEPVLGPEEDERVKEESQSGGLGLSLPAPVIPAEPEPAPPIIEAITSGAEVPSSPSIPIGIPPPIDTKPPLTVPEQLWLLLDFIESHFRETIEELERLEADGYMSYKLLWAICAPGDTIEAKDPATEYPVGMRVESWSYGSEGTKFTMQGATYSWDGKVFKQEVIPIEIQFFKGLMKADQVPIKVMTDRTKKDLIERGRIYQKYAGIHYLKYDAFIALTTERGIVKIPAKGRVIIDADGYSRYNLNTPGGYQPTSWNTYPTRMPPIHMPYPSPPMQQSRIPHEEYKNDDPLPDEIICLTPPTHKGWSFAAKAWGSILVTNLSEITFDELAFDQLVLKPEYKKMIKALVETHSGSDDGLAKDFVSGKGGGMVMVLHGKPGTGKTLTAEAVSEHLKCPLYVVSSGELGTEASRLEKQLHDILEMLHSRDGARGNTPAMTPPIAPEMRARIAHWRCNENRRPVECADLSGRSLRSVHTIVNLYKTHGTLHNPLARPRGRPRLLSGDDCRFIEGLIAARPTIYLDEIQLALEERRHVYASLPTISSTLNRLDITRKTVSREAYERDDLLRAMWQVEWGGYPAHSFVWLDESAVDNTTSLRNTGWAPRGQPCIKREFFFRGVRYSMLPALTTDGIEALDIFEGSVNRERFLTFFRAQVVPLLNPFTPAGAPKSIVVLDNCSIHHGDEIRRIVEEECGAKLCYLPTYSPDFNPIEKAFAAIKAHLRRQECRFVGPEARPWLIHEAAWAVSADNAMSWIKRCGYSGL